MKIYKTQAEVEANIKGGVLAIEGDVKFECPISISASIIVNTGDINAGNINARDISAGNINAWDISAGDINTGDINAWNIDARDINARNINARNIDAWDINAWNIDARDILYYAFCCVYHSIKCFSIKAKREKYQDPICLEGKLEIKKADNSLIGQEIKVEFQSKNYKAKIIH